MLIAFACGTFNAVGCEESVWKLIYAFLIPTLLAVGIGIGIIATLSAAISLITSVGDQKSTEEAWEKLKGAFTGLVILLIAYTIIEIIINSLSSTGAIDADISGGLRGSIDKIIYEKIRI